MEPDAPEGRRWAEEELGKAVYQDEPSPLERLAQWFLDLLEAVTDLGGTTPPQLVPVAVVLLAAGVLAVA
ncbi:hypothetical protein PU560_12885, partial [Georgenia sp. 10Sc9-8]|nr:hypothetical protein [Georgenia halotolerans]